MNRAKRRRRKTKAEREGMARLAREERHLKGQEARIDDYLRRCRRGAFLKSIGLA